MKATQLGLFSALGALLVGGGVYTATPDGGFGVAQREELSVESSEQSDSGSGSSPDKDDEEPASGSFQVGTTVRVDARLGHTKIGPSGPETTFALLELQGDERGKGAAPRVALSLVIDKSGSMRGARIQNAIQAAVTAIGRLRDGDSVSVVAFDTRTELVVPLTTIQSGSRASVLQAVRNLQLGGDTCVSCGIEDGLAELKKATSSDGGTVARMLVLSDGDANNGIRDVPGFRSLAERAMRQGVSITTIGVDLDYNEKIMSALAQGSNGRHYFVERDTDLPRVFDAEAATLTETVASSVTADFDLAPGVELVRVFDRTFSRSGAHLSVPLGAFSRGEKKTVLVELRLPKRDPGEALVTRVKVTYRDAVTEKDADVSGKLVAEYVSGGDTPSLLDALVLDRRERSETAAALREANTLFSLGKTDEARKRLESQQQSIADARRQTKGAAPSGRAGDVEKSFAAQEAELDRSVQNFKPAPASPDAAANAPAPASKSQVKRNAEQADFFGL